MKNGIGGEVQNAESKNAQFREIQCFPLNFASVLRRPTGWFWHSLTHARAHACKAPRPHARPAHVRASRMRLDGFRAASRAESGAPRERLRPAARGCGTQHASAGHAVPPTRPQVASTAHKRASARAPRVSVWPHVRVRLRVRVPVCVCAIGACARARAPTLACACARAVSDDCALAWW